MTSDTKTNPPYYIPLNQTSPCNVENVLFYNANASSEAIYECAIMRLKMVINLLESLYGLKGIKENSLPALTAICGLMLSDVYTLLEEFNPIAIKLRKETEDSN